MFPSGIRSLSESRDAGVTRSPTIYRAYNALTGSSSSEGGFSGKHNEIIWLGNLDSNQD
jgi:hypothetical protein